MRDGIELTKWVAVGAMLYDHLEVFSGWSLPFASAVGALAFPMFAIALGAALAEAQGEKRRLVVRRLVVAGLIAQVAVLLVRDALPLNVLFTMASGVMAYSALEESSGWRSVGRIAFALALGTLSEFQFIGTGVIVAALSHYRRGTSIWWIYAASLPLFAFNEMQLVAPLGVLGGMWLIENGPKIPRVKRAFYPVYILQYPFLRFL